MRAQIEVLTREIGALKARDNKTLHAANQIEPSCFVCKGLDHLPQECPTFAEMKGAYDEQCNALGVYRKPYSPYSETYNPGWRNHPNFSWKNENQQQNPPPQPRNFNAPQYHNPPPQPRNSLEDTLQIFIEAQGKTNHRFESLINQVVEENKDIKGQISKLTNALSIQEPGKIPSQAQPNPRGQHMVQDIPEPSNIRDVNAVTTRSGKQVGTQTLDPDVSLDIPQEEPVAHNPVRVPFPQALKPKSKAIDPNGEILEHLKQVKINLPLLHVIKQVPTYAKVLKDLCTTKRRHNVKTTAFLTEQASAVIEQRAPPKYKDPGCPTITYNIGTHEFGQALLDLGASVNLMPYSIYRQLGLGEIKPTTVVLQLADRSTRTPRGVVEDVLLQIDKFYYPVDFLILDTQSVVKAESKIPLILGRPFLATANALINCRNGLMKLSFGHMTLEINVFNIGKQPQDEDDCHQTYLIDSLVPEFASTLHDDTSLEHLLGEPETLDTLDPNLTVATSEIVPIQQSHSPRVWQPRFEELPIERERPKSSMEETPKVNLKELPQGLRHAFLGPGYTFPVIISSELMQLKARNCLTCSLSTSLH